MRQYKLPNILAINVTYCTEHLMYNNGTLLPCNAIADIYCRELSNNVWLVFQLLMQFGSFFTSVVHSSSFMLCDDGSVTITRTT